MVSLPVNPFLARYADKIPLYAAFPTWSALPMDPPWSDSNRPAD